MNKTLILLVWLFLMKTLRAQETVYPAPKQTGTTVISNATIHTGTGETIENGTIVLTDGKIVSVGKNVSAPAGSTTIDAKGKHVYPGLILPVSNLGLIEVSAVRATNDLTEVGELNPNIRSIVAYNTDSRVINTLRSNGILLANVVPQGSLVAGSSSVVQLDAWTWEDAAYKTDGGIHFYMPSLMPGPRFGGGGGGNNQQPPADPVKEGLEKIDRIKSFFKEAKAYFNEPTHEETNLKFTAVKGLFDKKQKLYIHANTVKQMLIVFDFVKEFGFDVVIVGGSDSWQIADLLKQNNVSVILGQSHSLPTLQDDDIDQPYKTAAMLQKAGVLFSITDDDPQNRGRNLPFNAGTAVAYGLTKEQALQAITLNAARIMGVADKTGSLEVGKDANIIISEGDILDMRTSIVTDAFIQGRKIDLMDKQKLLNERYKRKYGLKGF